MRKVLVVDDNPAVLDAFRVLLEIHDLPYLVTSTPDLALAAVERGEVGVLIQDMNFSSGRTSGEEGVALFRRLRAADAQLPILLMTAWTSLETAVQLVKEGATDYLAKPWDDAKLVDTVRRLLAARNDEPARYSAGTSGNASGHAADGGEDASRYSAGTHPEGTTETAGMVFRSAAMARLVRLAANVAAANVPVLITGPNGSGKEKLADLVHARSRRAAGPFVKVNVGALPIELVEAELFGAEAGAFTGSRTLRVGRFEAADGGTLFLDEIDSLPLAGQVKLLRALENGELQRLGSNTTRRVDVRVISATNADLRKLIEEGRFREDLYFRINVVELALPPLRERPEDLEPLAALFLENCARDRQGPVRALSAEAWAALRAYPWPGNVRELRNRLQRADLLASGPLIEAADLDLPAAVALPAPKTAEPGLRTGAPAEPDLAAERAQLERLFVDCDGVVARVAESLGISRQALYRKMARLGIVLERRPSATP
jgi:DNA-binding NtrC family response regulator